MGILLFPLFFTILSPFTAQPKELLHSPLHTEEHKQQKVSLLTQKVRNETRMVREDWMRKQEEKNKSLRRGAFLFYSFELFILLV